MRRGDERDDGQEVQHRQRRVHVGVAGAEGHAPRREVELPGLQHVVAGLGHHGDGHDGGEVGLDVRRQADPVLLVEHQRPVDDVGEGGAR